MSQDFGRLPLGHPENESRRWPEDWHGPVPGTILRPAGHATVDGHYACATWDTSIVLRVDWSGQIVYAGATDDWWFAGWGSYKPVPGEVLF